MSLNVAPKIKNYQWRQILKLTIGVIFKRNIIIDGLNTRKVIEKIIEDICTKNKIKDINEIEMPLLMSMVDLQTGVVYIASSKEIRGSLSDKTKYITNIPIGKVVRVMELQGRELSGYEKQGIDKLITINLKKVSLLDATKAEELYKIGYAEAKKQILKKM